MRRRARFGRRALAAELIRAGYCALSRKCTPNRIVETCTFPELLMRSAVVVWARV